MSTLKAPRFEQGRPGLRSGNMPDFELYDERFDGASGDGGVELWVSVQ